MMIQEYRKKVTRQVSAARKRAQAGVRRFRNAKLSAKERVRALADAGQLREEGDLDYAQEIAADGDQPADLRAAAIGQLAPLLSRRSKTTKFLIGRVGDPREPATVRGAAVTALKSAAFHATSFASHRAAYIEALRAAIDADDRTLRERALGVLAREKDAPTLRRIEQNLRTGSDSLVAPEKALQLLAYDTKRNVRDLLLDVVKNPPSPGARLQALRNLASDSGSKPFFSKLVHDKAKDREARLIAISALHAIDPEGFEELAAELASDEDEDEEIRGACLTAIATIDPGNAHPELREAAESLAGNAKSRAARAAAKLYLNIPSK